MDTKNKPLIVLAALVVIALIGITIYVMSDTDDFSEKERSDIITSEKAPGSDSGDRESAAKPSMDPEEELAAYKLWAQYPPTTRPLHEGQLDLLKPYTLPRTPVRVIAKPAEGCKKVDNKIVCEKEAQFADISCKMQPEKSHSFGTGDFHIYVYCTSLKNNTRMPIDSIEAEVFRRLGRRDFKAPRPIGISDKGDYGDKKAGDHIYTILVRPTLNEWGPIYVKAKMKVGGIEHVQQVDFYSTPHIVAEFQPSGIRDSIKDGHLVITLPVNVKKAGYYEFRANLQELEGEKRMVASASVQKRLEKGPQSVELRFWGKTIRDSGIDGPYLVRNIRGFRDNGPMPADELKKYMLSGTVPEPRETTEPEQEHLKPAPDLKTQPYEARQFSKEEWQSPEKEKRIKFLEGLI